jgi:hypothetical protein
VGARLDKFSFFFAFYGLILGLAVTELLGGFAGMVRAKAIRRIEAQTALLALLTFVAICATWIDAWGTLRTISLDFAGLWAPIMLATCYYLAAAVVFPSDPEDYGRLGAYYADRKRFVVAMLLAAELLVTFTFRDIFIDAARDRPAQLWVWLLPYNLVLTGLYVALLFVTSRRANIALLAALLLLFTVPYWGQGSIGAMIDRHWGYSPA